MFITNYEFETNKVSEPFKMIQISDFHNEHSLGSKMVNKVKEADPDIIVLTGDFVDGRRTDTEYCLKIAKQLVDIAPVYFVTGNHEASISGYSQFEQDLEEVGIRNINDNHVSINDSITLYGVYDPFNVGDFEIPAEYSIEDRLDSVDLNEKKFNILLSHRPEAFVAYSDFDLALTGHAHGGQFRIPFIGGMFAPQQGLFPKYDAEKYIQGDSVMIVSRGVGNSSFPLRVNNPPELVMITLS